MLNILLMYVYVQGYKCVSLFMVCCRFLLLIFSIMGKSRVHDWVMQCVLNLRLLNTTVYSAYLILKKWELFSKCIFFIYFLILFPITVILMYGVDPMH